MAIIDSEEYIDKLLIYMNDIVEAEGLRIGQVTFNFTDGNNSNDPKHDLKPTLDATGIKEVSDFYIILNKCLSRQYIKKLYANSRYDGLFLTESGQGRAISTVNGKNKENNIGNSNIHIGTINSEGQIQIGNHNIQNTNIEKGLKELIDILKKANIDTEDSRTLKKSLKSVLAHPIFTSILGASLKSIIESL